MKKTTVRTIYQIEIEETEHEIRMRFTGSGFLQNMVRILTGTLVEVGRGERTPEDMERILESRDRQQAGFLMPAKRIDIDGSEVQMRQAENWTVWAKKPIFRK